MFHANLQPVILHIVTNSYLLAVNRLLWHICISEKQFDNINEIFNDTLNIHPHHPYIYLKLQKILYQVLLQYENAHMCQTLPPHTPKNNISVNYIILLSPSSIRKLQTISLSLMLYLHTHTHISLDLIITVPCTQKCHVSDWLLFTDISEAAKTNEHT